MVLAAAVPIVGFRSIKLTLFFKEKHKGYFNTGNTLCSKAADVVEGSGGVCQRPVMDAAPDWFH